MCRNHLQPEVELNAWYVESVEEHQYSGRPKHPDIREKQKPASPEQQGLRAKASDPELRLHRYHGNGRMHASNCTAYLPVVHAGILSVRYAIERRL